MCAGVTEGPGPKGRKPEAPQAHTLPVQRVWLRCAKSGRRCCEEFFPQHILGGGHWNVNVNANNGGVNNVNVNDDGNTNNAACVQ